MKKYLIFLAFCLFSGMLRAANPGPDVKYPDISTNTVFLGVEKLHSPQLDSKALKKKKSAFKKVKSATVVPLPSAPRTSVNKDPSATAINMGALNAALKNLAVKEAETPESSKCELSDNDKEANVGDVDDNTAIENSGLGNGFTHLGNRIRLYHAALKKGRPEAERDQLAKELLRAIQKAGKDGTINLPEDQPYKLPRLNEEEFLTPLHVSICHGIESLVTALLQNGSSVNAMSEYLKISFWDRCLPSCCCSPTRVKSQTAMHLAVKLKKYKLIPLLLETADLTLKDRNGKTVLDLVNASNDLKLKALFSPRGSPQPLL